MSKRKLEIRTETATVELVNDFNNISLDVTTVDGDTITVAYINEEGILCINDLDDDQVDQLKPYFEFDGTHVQVEND